MKRSIFLFSEPLRFGADSLDFRIEKDTAPHRTANELTNAREG